MDLLISPGGDLRCVYGETIDLHALGCSTVSRASHVEPDRHGRWFADLSPVDGPLLGPFRRRSEALAAEERWLASHFFDRSDR